MMKADQPSNAGSPSRTSVGRALLIGELVINVPVIGLLVGVTAGIIGAVGANYEKSRFVFPAAALIAFCLAWAYWSVVTPRWLLWAMNRVTDPKALRKAAIFGSILWPDTRWGRALNNTQWRSADMKRREHELLQSQR
jgi:hypothetical protein